MAYIIPTTAELTAQNKANFESNLAQNVPANDKAFLNILSAMEAALAKGNYNYAAERAKQCLAITATGVDLDVIGRNYGVIRKAAESAQFTATLPATTGTVIPITVDFVGDANGVRYSLDVASTSIAGVATLQLTAQVIGSAGNLEAGDTLTIGQTVPGATSQATITAVTNTGANREIDDDYRIRILDILQAIPGGGNASDYRIWAQEVAGVARAYPFAGLPIGDPSYPGAPPNRTVYVEATTDIDPDGIAPSSLLDEVRDTITTDPETGLSRQPLGLTDDTLYVESIIRSSFYVTISDLVVDANQLANVQSQILTSLTQYFRSVRPFVDGVDSPLNRNDTLTDPSVSEVIQDVVSSAGGSVSSVAFDTTPGGSISRYQLAQNELAKLGGITYA